MTTSGRPLEGRVALVTGAGSGIGMGRVMALALIEHGAHVAMLDVDAPSLERSVNDARELGGDGAAVGVVADVSRPEDAERAVREAVSAFGGLHVLINTAGLGLHTGRGATKSAPLWDVSTAAWDAIISVNLTGSFLMTRAAVRPMIEQGWGRVIGVTTSLDTMIRGHNVPYGPSKAGHEAMIAALAQELAGTGVTANVLVPGGATYTGFFTGVPDVDRAAMIQPEVMRGPVQWLCSTAADDFNGMRVIAIDWDEDLPIEQRLAKASAPAGWPQLGRQTVRRP